MQQRSRCPRRSPTPRGIHHLALCTDDIKTTIDFYVDVLGVPLVHAMRVPPGLGSGPGNRGNPPYERIRHYFFDMGNDSLLAFFEIPKGKQLASNRNAIGAMQHCAFVVTPERFREVEAHATYYMARNPGIADLLRPAWSRPNAGSSPSRLPQPRLV